MMFKKRSTRYIFIVSLAIAILFPIINIYVIYPSFADLLIKNTENEAMRLGNHLSGMFFRDKKAISRRDIDRIDRQVEHLIKDFNLLKLKIFSTSGEITYSTDPKDIGKVNNNSYFYDIVAKGKSYSKIVKKETESLEGQKVSRDVVETYVPMIGKGMFIGAFEMYYDITARNAALTTVIRSVSAIPLGLMFVFLCVITAMLIRQDKQILKQESIESELVDLNSQLESEIIVRNKAEKELLVFSEKLQISNKELESFAHVASHDLQEPLRKITAFGDRLHDKCADELGEQGQDYLRRMQSAATRMHSLINGLLMYSRVTTKAHPFKPVDLGTVIEDVISDLELRIDQSGAKVEVSELPTIDADPIQMHQLLQNLVSNALKFSNKDEPLVVTVSSSLIQDNENGSDSSRASSDQYEITIEDTGIGFDEKYADRIFGVFQRLHGKNEYEGTGIGLSVCKKIAERHGGSIAAKGTLGEGAKFIVTLPTKHSDGEEEDEYGFDH
jgi:signal transduction histidine kinase